ncbi:hypothetical protein LUZ61_011488 [Rhynchospora tenuis]|uniref:Nitrate regulatory gene2 protein n=1 Tax=Rhynchospora tenuis TaxID=198213 RepID=A0AAD6A1K6_9POAL|nr:hypothetical protein LUZ61_011488 [Rhynchospora tenuis]
MGCRISKSDEPTVPVILCRERRDLIRAVSDHRRALASAHSAYFHSLSRVGDALLQFVQQDLASISTPSALSLPPSPDGKNVENLKPKSPKSESIEKESDLALSDSSVSPFHSSCASPHPGQDPDPHCLSGSDNEESAVGEDTGFRGNPQWPPYAGFSAYPGLIPTMGTSNYQYNYMKSSSTVPTTVYQQAYGDNTNQVYMDYGYGYNYPMYGFEMPPEPVQNQEREERIDAESPPPPPPEPTVSSWDFFNPFDLYEQSLNVSFAGLSGVSSGSMRSSPNSSEVREREGIPHLEEETEPESCRGSSKGDFCSSETGHEESIDDGHGVCESENVVQPIELVQSVEPVKLKSNNQINVKTKKVKKVSFEDDAVLVTENVGSNEILDLAVQTGTRKVEEAATEIKEEFGSLVSCGAEVAKLLEVGSAQYRSRNRVLRFILSRILGSLLSSTSFCTSQGNSTSKLENTGDEFEFNNLSSILDRLYAWEKKLYKEIKGEEKLRLRYEREWKRLKTLDENGAEASKIDATRTVIRKLGTQLNIAVREVEFISSRIHKLRDDELQPALTNLFQGLMRMWRLIFSSHHKQLQAVLESKPDRLVLEKQFHTSTSDPMIQLELELLNWGSSFSNWIQAQNSYVHTLNQYLLKWLPQYTEETDDGPCPFSPTHIGAPPVFILSNDWAHMAERVSECNVTDKIQAFALSVHLLLERQDLERQHKIKADYLSKDLAKRVKILNSSLSLEEGDKAKDGKMVTIEGLMQRLDLEKAKHKDAANLVQEASTGNLKAGLGPIFKALESYSSEVLRGLEEVRFPNGGITGEQG